MYEGKKKQTNKEERRTNRLHPNQLNINVQRRYEYRDHPLNKINL